MQNCSDRLHNMTEGELVREAQQGSGDAFAELVRRHRWPMLYVASGILKRQEDAEDAVQAALWSAFHHLPGFRRESSFKTWLTSITVNQARMRRRELTRASRLFSEEPAEAAALWVEDPNPTAEQSCAEGELIEALHREIRRLPAPQRQVMLLHVESCSAADLAASLGLSLSAAKARLCRARTRLLDRMRVYTSSPEPSA